MSLRRRLASAAALAVAVAAVAVALVSYFAAGHVLRGQVDDGLHRAAAHDRRDAFRARHGGPFPPPPPGSPGFRGRRSGIASGQGPFGFGGRRFLGPPPGQGPLDLYEQRIAQDAGLLAEAAAA